MAKKIKILNSSSWAPEIAMLKICIGIDDVTVALGGYSRLRAARMLFYSLMKNPGDDIGGMPTDLQSNKDRVKLFLLAISKHLKSHCDLEKLEYHPVVWYWFLRKHAPLAICDSFRQSVIALDKRGVSDGKVTIVQLKHDDGKWTKPKLGRAASIKDLHAGVTISRLARRNFDPDIAKGFWRVYRKNHDKKTNGSKSAKLEAALVEVLKEMRRCGLGKNIHEKKNVDLSAGPIFSTSLYQKNGIKALMECTKAGKEILNSYKEKTINRSLTRVVITSRGNIGAKREGLIAEAKEILAKNLEKV